MSRPNAWYGWRPDKPDIRDIRFKVERAVILPPAIDLRGSFPPCYDQGQLGSCTANAIAGCLEFDQLKQSEKNSATPSRLFIYYNERVMEGTISEDAGAEIRDGIKSVNDLGAPAEKLWPYKPAKFTKKPTQAAYRSAKAHQTVSYARLDGTSIVSLKSCLALGFPFAFGFTCYDYFEGDQIAKDGILKLPAPGEQVVGGHAVVGVGYDDATQMILVRNSWAADWGDKGYFYMPYAYITNKDLADDFWVIRQVE